MENESQRIQVDPCHIQYTKRNVRQVSWATPRQKAYLAQTHFRKTETTRYHRDKNVLVIRTKVKKQQTSRILNNTLTNLDLRNTSFGYGVHFQHIWILERFQSKAMRMIVDAPWYVPNTVIRRNLQIPTVKEKIRRYSSQYSARLSAHSCDLIVNLTEIPENWRLRRHLPNDLPTRFLAQLSYS
jgi:hypothetical protein